MPEHANVLPAVLRFIQSFPPRKRRTSDIKHFPFKKQIHCFKCGRETDHFRAGIFQNVKKPEKNYKKWVVHYDCDLCKEARCYKYVPPEEELRFLPVKCDF